MTEGFRSPFQEQHRIPNPTTAYGGPPPFSKGGLGEKSKIAKPEKFINVSRETFCVYFFVYYCMCKINLKGGIILYGL